MPISLPAPTNLEFIKKQSKDLRRAFAEGDADALQRIHDHLPRARQLEDDDLRGLDLSLQEAQHALACEYGFDKWEDLLIAVEPPGFEELIRLPGQVMTLLLREVDQRDLVCALIGASDEVVEDFLLSRCMSARVRAFIRSEIVFAGTPPAGKIEAARARIVAKVLDLRERDQLTWPPSADTQASAAAHAPDLPRTDRLSVPLLDMTADELLDALAWATQEARREGIIALERHINRGSATLLTEGVQLATDGTNTDLLVDLLEIRAATILRARTTQARLAIEGWLSIEQGDNPSFVQLKMESMFDEATEIAPYPDFIPTAAELMERLRDTRASYATPAQMVTYYRDLGTLRRLEGLPALLALVDAIEDPVLVAGIRASVEDALEPLDVVEAMKRCAQRERLEPHRRNCMVIEGLASIQAGDRPEYLREHVRRSADRSVADLAAMGFPSHGE